MNVLRMIKLFGWEMRVKDLVAEKRDIELKALWRRKVLELANNAIKCATPLYSCHTLIDHTSSHTVPLIHMIVTYTTFVSSRLDPRYRTTLMADVDLGSETTSDR